MTRRVAGGHINVTDTIGTPVETVNIPVAPAVPAPMQMARNGLYVNAFNSGRLMDLANHLARHRPKCIAGFATTSMHVGGGLHPGPPHWVSPATTRERWRFAYHSSPYAGLLRVELIQLRQELDGGVIHAVAGTIVITVSTMAGTPVATATIAGAPGAIDSDDNLLSMRNMFLATAVFVDPSTGAPVALPVDTDLQVLVEEKEFARIVSLCMYEDTLPGDTGNGHLMPNISSQTPILAEHRQDVANILRSMWLRGSKHVFNWSRLIRISDGAVSSPSTTSATLTNILDGASTSVTASSVGFYTDLSVGLARLNIAGVKAVVQVWGKCTSASNGLVRLKQASGGQIDVGPFTTSFSWVSGTAQLDASAGKIDMMFSTAAGTFTVGAVSVYLLE